MKSACINVVVPGQDMSVLGIRPRSQGGAIQGHCLQGFRGEHMRTQIQSDPVVPSANLSPKIVVATLDPPYLPCHNMLHTLPSSRNQHAGCTDYKELRMHHIYLAVSATCLLISW